MTDNLPVKSEFLVYQTKDGVIKIDVRLEDETVWLTQQMMADLFQTTPQNITLHLKNIFNEGELNETATCKDFLQVKIEGKRRVERKKRFYNLDDFAKDEYECFAERRRKYKEALGEAELIKTSEEMARQVDSGRGRKTAVATKRNSKRDNKKKDN
ncbi:MAG: hypothetical protein ABFD75_01550 [Smithella sp.]